MIKLKMSHNCWKTNTVKPPARVLSCVCLQHLSSMVFQNNCRYINAVPVSGWLYPFDCERSLMEHVFV